MKDDNFPKSCHLSNVPIPLFAKLAEGRVLVKGMGIAQVSVEIGERSPVKMSGAMAVHLILVIGHLPMVGLTLGGRFQRHLRWLVPASARISMSGGRQPIHDERLISAALVAEGERLIRLGKINLGLAKSAVIWGFDPLDLSW